MLRSIEKELERRRLEREPASSAKVHAAGTDEARLEVLPPGSLGHEVSREAEAEEKLLRREEEEEKMVADFCDVRDPGIKAEEEIDPTLPVKEEVEEKTKKLSFVKKEGSEMSCWEIKAEKGSANEVL